MLVLWQRVRKFTLDSGVPEYVQSVLWAIINSEHFALALSNHPHVFHLTFAHLRVRYKQII